MNVHEEAGIYPGKVDLTTWIYHSKSGGAIAIEVFVSG